ncbi:MAG: hypothetical protein NZ551_03805 [Microscillaceae bacterium]|nr:hypothetical protein [Microscillaceae bacterium]MDW8460314.1 hypothetical protein [Cytophagales bacterium]
MFKKSVYLWLNPSGFGEMLIDKSVHFLGLLALLVLFSCVRKETTQEVKVRELDRKVDASIIAQIEASGQRGIPLPEGSVIMQTSESTYQITLPANYYYVVSDANDNNRTQIEPEPVSVTCSCTNGTGCSPVRYDGKYYCISKPQGKICTASISKVANSRNSTRLSIKGLMNKSAGITLLSDKELPKKGENSLINFEKIIRHTSVIHGNAFTALFEVDEVKKYFSDLGEQYRQAGKEPNKYAYLNIYGNLALVPFTEGLEIEIEGVKYAPKTANGSLKEIDANIVCKCTQGSGCKKEKMSIPFVGTAYYCEAGNCSKCSLLD